MAARKKQAAARGAKKAVRRLASTASKVAKALDAADYETRDFVDGAAFRAWLKKNHASSPGLWVRFAKKAAGVKSITRAEAVDAALRWGWIDGQGKSVDARYWLTKFTPRRARSIWSKINRVSAIELIARGEMEAPGLAEIERAKADGRWDAAYDSPKTSVTPPDLARALAANPKAAAFFKTLNSANRYAILWRVQTAKRPETRARRIEQFIAMLANGQKLHP